jgi:hypothetical protein
MKEYNFNFKDEQLVFSDEVLINSSLEMKTTLLFLILTWGI